MRPLPFFYSACMLIILLCKIILAENSRALWQVRCYLQGPQFGHVIETGDRDAADVVIVQGSVE